MEYGSSSVPLLYVETTVWSFAFADDSPDMREATLEFFEACRAGKFGTVIGRTVLEEVHRAEPAMRDALLALIKHVGPTVFSPSEPVAKLAQEFLRLGAVPPSKPDDAAHVAYAFVGAADALVSWNFKHITSIKRAEKFNAIALLNGYGKRLIIAAPAEVMYGDA